MSTPRSAERFAHRAIVERLDGGAMQRTTISLGVFAGATSPCQVVASKPLIRARRWWRDREDRGTLERCHRQRPHLAVSICGTTDAAVANIMCTWPAITSCSAGAAPL